MPSKSKAQARFFAAMASNPKARKKHGMSAKTAKEWHNADKKRGTKRLPTKKRS
jgi:transposase